MTSPATPDPRSVIALLTEQRRLYTELRTLSQRQRGLISGDQPEELLNVLRDRQSLVAALARLNHDLAPFRRNWEATYSALPEGDRTQAAELLSDVSALLRTILQSDQEDGALLAARKQLVARELAEIDSTRTAASAYGRQAAAGASPGGSTLKADLAG
ncbi:MAG: flagellar protein FlgN [Planctomycetia bacterium]|nr:MAG: flagellar protein FlgN [Planctomycetia bacterium]